MAGLSAFQGSGMGGNPRRKNGYRRTELLRWLRAQERPCWICKAFGRPARIDYELPHGHPASFECDELIPVSKGGSPFDKGNVDASHRACNEWRGNKSVGEVLRLAQEARALRAEQQHRVVSRKW